MVGIRLIILPIIGMAVLCLGNPLTNVSADEDVMPGEFPWHVGIFFDNDGEYEQICYGSIIRKKLILTVAHCFQRSKNPADYKVAAAKYHKSWEITDEMEQRLDVKSIEIKDTYDGANRNYADDIAVLILKDEVTITDFVQPIGVDLDSQYVNLQLSAGVYGYVAAWGHFQNGTETNLLEKRALQFQDFVQCYKDSLQSFRPYFTSDKFCAGYDAESAICYIDSGAALAFKKEVTATKEQWLVQGIVSLGVPLKTGSTCNNQRRLFTRVSSHMAWLRQYYEKY